MSYRHSQKNHKTNYFTFNITNEITNQKLKKLTFKIKILPPPLNIKTKNLNIRKKKKKPLSPTNIILKFTTPTNLSIIFHIIKQPKHNHLKLIKKKNQSLFSFTINDLKQKKIYYIHNKNDSKLNKIIIKNRITNKKKTNNQHVYIHIKTINNKTPRIITNKNLTL